MDRRELVRLKVQILIDIPEGAKLEVPEVAPVTLDKEEQVAREHKMYCSELADQAGMMETANQLTDRANHRQNMALSYARSNAVVAMIRRLGMVALSTDERFIWKDWLPDCHHQNKFVTCRLDSLPPVEILEQIARAKTSGLFDELFIRYSQRLDLGYALFGCIGCSVYLLDRWSEEPMLSFDWLKQGSKLRQKVDKIFWWAWRSIVLAIALMLYVGADQFVHDKSPSCRLLIAVSALMVVSGLLTGWIKVIRRRHPEVFKRR